MNGDVPSFGFTRFRYDPLLPVFDTFLTLLCYIERESKRLWGADWKRKGVAAQRLVCRQNHGRVKGGSQKRHYLLRRSNCAEVLGHI